MLSAVKFGQILTYQQDPKNLARIEALIVDAQQNTYDVTGNTVDDEFNYQFQVEKRIKETDEGSIQHEPALTYTFYPFGGSGNPLPEEVFSDIKALYELKPNLKQYLHTD